MWHSLSCRLLRSAPPTVGRRGWHSSAVRAIAVGAPLPNLPLQEGSPANELSALEFFKPYSKAILIGVPGAFTPGCSRTHVPGYLEWWDTLRAKGVEAIGCVAVNDAFVMDAWGKSLDDQGHIHFLADPQAQFVKALDLSFDASGVLGGIRAKRFALVLEHGVVKDVQVEPDNTGLSCSLAPNVAKHFDA
ncbi:Peroxiredoxin-5, mitochondrial [Dimargaris xerosporica]|nr:Peroxiredoxin-5, mitochondrial [Dimargaris xerosporica]